MMNPCEDCGLCCMETEMVVSKKDISRILDAIKFEIKESDFIEETLDGYLQLKNIEGHCFFLDPNKKECKIYEVRPAGCRFYPIVYDLETGKCIYDKECPRIQYFRLPDKGFKMSCKHVKEFLIEECKFAL